MTDFGALLIAATALVPAFQLFALPGITDQAALFSQYLGLNCLILMAWGQILATRLPGIESIFGGLDQVYVLHKWTGIIAMITMLLHDTIDADIRGLGRETLLNGLGETLGEISLYGLLILVVISIATVIPYHLWKWTHKAMGALFIAGALHFTLIIKPFAMTDPAGLYTGLFCLAGIAAYIWTLLPDRMKPSCVYKITGIEETAGATAITLTPTGKGLSSQPGQFGVFSFNGSGHSEPHPFTFSGAEDDGTLRVTIKPLGDFTSSLASAIEVGQDVRVQGPFGRFRMSPKNRQVWVAGGIGITPFLTWANALNENSPPVDLFYCVRSRAEAPHLDEIEALAQELPNLTLHLIVSGEGQRLNADTIADLVGPDIARAKVSFCGPVALRESLRQGRKRHGVSSRRFYYEEFEFRTGIGLDKLANWVMTRRVSPGRILSSVRT